MKIIKYIYTKIITHKLLWKFTNMNKLVRYNELFFSKSFNDEFYVLDRKLSLLMVGYITWNYNDFKNHKYIKTIPNKHSKGDAWEFTDDDWTDLMGEV